MASLIYFSLLIILLFTARRESLSSAEDASLARYIERRILTLEDRLFKCEQDIQQHMQELKELSHKLLVQLKSFSRYKAEAKTQMDNLLARVERAEWDIDYLETTTTSSNTCLEVDDQLMEKQLLDHEVEKKQIQLKLNTSCNNMLAHVASQKTVKKAGPAIGSWMKNADPQPDSEEIYVFAGANNNVVLKFTNITDFTSADYMQKAENLSLPFYWQGAGHVVSQDSIYFHKDGTRNVIIQYKWKENVTHSMELHGAGEIPPYQLSPFTKIDLGVDEQGLWTIHADSSADRNLILSKVDHKTMAIEHVWNTSCDSTNAEAAFVVCGTLYVMYNSPSGGRSHIDCIYDTLGIVSVQETPTLYFPRRYSSHSSVHYNPTDQTLYSWDEGYQILYKFEMKTKFSHI
ncbi:olfactomedin-like protein 1 [Pelodytes ibericus]